MLFSKSEKDKIREYVVGISKAASSNFGVRLKKIREYSKMSQAEFANLLDVSYSSIGYYENGKRTPDINFLNKVVEITGLSPYYLLGIRETAFEEYNTDFSALNLSDKASDLLMKYNELGKIISAFLDAPSSLGTLRLFYDYIAGNYIPQNACIDEDEKYYQWITRGEDEEQIAFMEVMVTFSKTVRELSEINKKEGCYRYDYVKRSNTRIRYPHSGGARYQFKNYGVVLSDPQKVENYVQKERASYESIRNRYKDYLYSCFVGEDKNDKNSSE